MTIFLVLLIVSVVLFAAWHLWPGPFATAFRILDRKRGRLRSCRIDVGEANWHVLEGGHGEALVLLHGFNADADHFNRTARHLSSHFRILAPDLPGFGETVVGASVDYRIEAQAESVVRWMDAEGIQRCFLGGSSMGGYIALAIAARHDIGAGQGRQGEHELARLEARLLDPRRLQRGPGRGQPVVKAGHA